VSALLGEMEKKKGYVGVKVRAREKGCFWLRLMRILSLPDAASSPFQSRIGIGCAGFLLCLPGPPSGFWNCPVYRSRCITSPDVQAITAGMFQDWNDALPVAGVAFTGG